MALALSFSFGPPITDTIEQNSSCTYCDIIGCRAVITFSISVSNGLSNSDNACQCNPPLELTTHNRKFSLELMILCSANVLELKSYFDERVVEKPFLNRGHYSSGDNDELNHS